MKTSIFSLNPVDNDEQLARQVQELRDGVNRLAVEVFCLTTELDEVRDRRRLMGGPTTADDQGTSGLDAFPPERPRPTAALPTATPPSPETRIDVAEPPPARAGTTSRTVGAVGLGALVLVGVALTGDPSEPPIDVGNPVRAIASAEAQGPTVSSRDVSGADDPAAGRGPESPLEQPIVDPPVRDDPVSRLTVARAGVGSRIVGRELEGQANTFAVGTTVAFWTHVTGGGPGDTVRHVWLHEGRETAAVALLVESPSWRTHSRYTLPPGGVGDWTVEVRDDAGRVLARQRFQCQEAVSSR